MSETTEVRYTPGPWVTQPDQLGRDGARWWVHDGDYGDIALVLAPLVREDWVAEEAEANARLIAAAPDLLAACRALAKWMDDRGPMMGGRTGEVHRLVTAAIARAEGRATPAPQETK